MHLHTIFAVFTCLLLTEYTSSSSSAAVKARIDSCPGCSLNRLPEVRKFVYEDIPKYENVEFKKIHGAPPELVLLNDLDEEIERIPLSKLSREECNNLLRSKGFSLKSESSSNKEL